MKALLCGMCGDVRGLQEDWVACHCGNVEAHWTDARTGRAEFRATRRDKAFVLGLNNHLLVPLITGDVPAGSWPVFQSLHEVATDAPNHVFDLSRAACWAVVIPVGMTGDVRWADVEESPS